MAEDTDRLIQTGIEHLGRFAFYTRDNPFVSSRAGLGLNRERRDQLAALLDGTIKPEEWLDSDVGRSLIRTIKIGLVPRDLRLVIRDEEPVVGVESVHAFLQAHVFWWLVSILWCLSLAESVDALLPNSVYAFRFHSSFLKDPTTSGRMFRNQTQAHERWKSFPVGVAKEYPEQAIATLSLDVRSFYYSVDALPADVLSTFFAHHDQSRPRKRHVRVLTALLGALHQRYAELCGEVQPRQKDLRREGESPLPVGLPSSQVMANLILSMVVADVEALPTTLAVASYVDDLIVMSRFLPEFEESKSAYFARLGLADPEERFSIPSKSTMNLAHLTLNLEKSGTSYSRHVDQSDPDAEQAEELPTIGGDWEPYLGEDSSPDWGGRLRTVLHAPYKRDRIPKQLRRDILRLMDEVRVGLGQDEARERLNTLIQELDPGLFVALRPYWCEMLVIAFAAGDLTLVEELTSLLARVSDVIDLTGEPTAAARRALQFGLRASWMQALAQAIAVATDPADREALLDRVPELDLGQRTSLRTKSVIEYASRIRRHKLVPNSMVAAPLSEFTDWEGRLIGANAFADFLEWSRERLDHGASNLAEAVSKAVRFIHLHEACLAVHLWAGAPEEEWLDEAFSILANQPLIQPDRVAESRAAALGALHPGTREVDDDAKYALRFGMPSMQVDGRQLNAMIRAEADVLGEIARGSRANLRKVVRGAAKNKVDFLVLPEWAVLPQNLLWLMEESSRKQMLVVGGQAPEVVNGEYLNRLWTGIPIKDSAGHRACLVPPPRQKKFLSPEEKSQIRAGKATAAAPSAGAAIYLWRGIRFASLLCFEFADVGIREEVRFDSDLLTVSSWNRDWRYFEAVQDATTRDNYCLTVCVNTGAIPGTRIVRPVISAKAVAAAIHGSDDATVITKRIDMRAILMAQLHQSRPSDHLKDPLADDMSVMDYKSFPPV